MQILVVNASQPLHTPAGNLLYRIYYRTSFLESTLKSHEHSGYPHNGPEHTLRLRLSAGDLGAFLDLVLETFGDSAQEFVQSVRIRAMQCAVSQP